MKVLVTGAQGFVGSHLCEFLYQKGYEVRGLLHHTDPAVLAKQDKRYEWMLGDVNDPESLRQATEKCGMVFHLAALPRYNPHIPGEEFMKVNGEGTRLVLEACRLNNVKRVVYLSSVEAVGLSETGQPLNEESPCHPRNVYAEGKLKGEYWVKEYRTLYGMDCVVARIGQSYGPTDRLSFDRYFRPIRRGFYPLFGGGKALMEFAYVKNTAYGLWLVGEKGRSGETYFLSDERSYTFKEVVFEIAAQMGVRLHVIPIPATLAWMCALLCEGLSKLLPFYPFRIPETGRPAFARKTVEWVTKSCVYVNNAKAKKELGYHPPYSLQEGLKETVAWYREKGWL